MSCSVHNQSFNVGGAKKLENIHVQVSSTCGMSGGDTAVQHDGLCGRRPAPSVNG